MRHSASRHKFLCHIINLLSYVAPHETDVHVENQAYYCTQTWREYAVWSGWDDFSASFSCWCLFSGLIISLCLSWLPLHAVIRVCQVNHWMAEVRVGSYVTVKCFSRQCVKHVQVVLIHCLPLSSTVAGSLSRRSGEIRLLCPPTPPLLFPHPLRFTPTHHSCTFLPLIQTYPALMLLPLFTCCTWFPIILL